MKFKLPLTLFCLFLVSCEKGDIEIFDSRPIFSSNLSGKWVLVNYWADWCPPCIKEIPELNNLQRNYSNKLKVFLINFDMLEGEELNQQLKKFNVKVDSLLSDPSTIYKWVIPENLPVTFIINKNGDLEHTLVGPQTEEEIISLLSL